MQFFDRLIQLNFFLSSIYQNTKFLVRKSDRMASDEPVEVRLAKIERCQAKLAAAKAGLQARQSAPAAEKSAP